MRSKLLVAALCALALVGCQSQMRMLESGGALRVEKSNSPGSDYVVYIKNSVDFGFTPDDKANRDKWALEYMKTQCPAAQIVSEDEIATGTFGTGRTSKTYLVYIKCR